MELQHIRGNTYAVVGTNAMMVLYRLNNTDIILIDTGMSRKDRAGLDALLEEAHFVPKGVICSHAHYDHSGNTAYLRRRWGAQTASQLMEAGIAASPEAYWANYPFLTYEQCRSFFAEECFPTDVIISPAATSLTLCGTSFGVLQLPGHTAGQIGIITPDNVAYLADCLMGPVTLASAKLPTTMCIADDLRSKASLRELHCEAYVLAHRDIVEDIHPLVDRNIALYHEKAQAVLACLTGGMTSSQWRSALSSQMGFRTQDPFKLGVIRRNFSSFVTYLEDTGQVSVQWLDSTKHYFRS